MIGILEPPPYAVLSSAFVIPAFVYALSRPSVTSCCSFSFSTPYSYCTSGDTFCRSFRAGELADRVAPFQARNWLCGNSNEPTNGIASDLAFSFQKPGAIYSTSASRLDRVCSEANLLCRNPSSPLHSTDPYPLVCAPPPRDTKRDQRSSFINHSLTFCLGRAVSLSAGGVSFTHQQDPPSRPVLCSASRTFLTSTDLDRCQD